MSQIFISYSHKDSEYAHKLQRHLFDEGFDAWIDERIDYGSHWPREIERRIRKSAVFILIMSPNSQESEWVENELAFARQLKKPIFPLLLDGTVWWHLQTTQYVDVRGEKIPPTRFFIRLAKIVAAHKPDAPKSQATVDAGEETSNVGIGGGVSGSVIIAGSGNVVHLGGGGESRLEIVEDIPNEETEEMSETAPAFEDIQPMKPLLPPKKIKRWTVYWCEARNLIRILFIALKSKSHGFSQTMAGYASKPLFRQIFILAGIICAIVITVMALSKKVTTLSFTGNEVGKVNVYVHDGEIATKFTQTSYNISNWSPAMGIGGDIYFTSNRGGKAEIYRLINGQVEQVTYTPEQYESWSPALGIGGEMYFTSNRDGKPDIYRLFNGQIERVTHTPGGYESWMPAIGINGEVYFTSNRDGKAEIYRLFNGQVHRVTNTAWGYESWGPVIRGQNVYFTSNRSGRNQVYLLAPVATVISDITSWTRKKYDKFPEY